MGHSSLPGTPRRLDPGRVDPAPTKPGKRPPLFTAVAASYIVSTALGVVMRFELLGFNTGLPFDHLLHAHSHTLYFGWAGLGALLAMIDLLPGESRNLRRTASFLALLLPAILLGFLALGYHPVTIAISTVVMFGWYLAAWLWWRQARRVGAGLHYRFLAVGVLYLVASSLGIWVLGFLQATDRGTVLSESLAIHAFLLGFAWFLVFSVVGLLLARAPELGIEVDEDSLRRALAWWAPLALVTFPLGVAGGPEVAGLGPLARVAGLALLYPAWLWARTLWRSVGPGPRQRSWRLVSMWFAMASLSTAAVAVAGTDALLAGGRQGVVIYLHVLLVGFVTTSLFALLAGSGPRVLATHHLGLAAMVGGLAMAALGWVTSGFWVAAIGSVGLWGAGVWALGPTSADPGVERRPLARSRPRPE